MTAGIAAVGVDGKVVVAAVAAMAEGAGDMAGGVATGGTNRADRRGGCRACRDGRRIPALRLAERPDRPLRTHAKRAFGGVRCVGAGRVRA